MKKRIRQALCIVSVLVLMCVSFVLPASADTTYPALTTSNVSDVLLANYKNILNKHWGTSDLACIVAWAQNSDNSFAYRIEVFDKKYIGTTVSYNVLNYGHIGDNGFETTENIVNGYWNNFNHDFSNPFYTSPIYKSLTGQSSIQFHIVYSNIKIDGVTDIVDPDLNSVPAPFTVTYSPDLKLNLKRKTSDYETKSIDVTLTLNQDYFDWYIRRYAEMKLNVEVGKLDSESIEAILDTKNLAEVFDLTGCGKSKCIYFISLSDPSKPLRTVTQNSVYTYLSQQRYSIVDRDNGDIDGSTSTAVYANGLYPYFTVDFNEYFKHTMQSDIASENCSYKKYQAVIKNLPTYHFSIPLENIDAEKFEVISVLNSILTCETLFPTESGQSVFDDSFKSAYSVDRGPNGVNFNNIDYINVDKWDTDDTGYLDYFSKSDCYSVYTAKFSFDSYPKYVPLKDGKGNDIDMIKTNPFDYSMHPVKPGTYQSVGQDGTLSEERTEEEQKKHDEEVKNAQNFANVDFGIDGIKSIFDGTSVFYSFLTASIAILPNYFLIILGSFFVCMLAICVVKWVLK